MFCGNCGNPVDENALFCPNCGTPVEQEVQAAEPAEEAPVFEEVEQVTDVEEMVPAAESDQGVAEPEQPSFELNTEGEMTQPKKKISKIPFLIGGIVVVVAAVLLAVFNWANVSGFFVRTFSSPEKLQTKVYENVVSKAVDTVTVSEKDKEEATVDIADMGVEGELRLTVDDQVLSMIPTDGIDISWLSEIAIGYDMSVKNNLGKMALDLILGNTNLVSADAVIDGETMEYWITVPELNDQSIYVNMNELMEEMTGTSIVSMVDSEKMEMIADVIPSAEILKRIAIRYVGVLMSGFGDVEKSKEKVEVSGVSQNLHVLKATMDEEDLLEIVENLIKTLKKDDNIKDIILAMEKFSGEEGMYDSFIESMDEALASLDEADLDEMSGFKITLITYLNDANHIVGITAKMSMGKDMKIEPFSWIRVEQGKKYASEMVISSGTESIIFEGKGENGKTKNGEYVLSYDGDEILTVELKDYVSDDDQLSGTIRIIPSEEVMESLMDEMDLDEFVSDLIGTAEPALEIKFDSKDKSGSFSIALAAGDKNLIAISASGAITEPDAITVPENYVDMADEESSMEWLENMNVDFLDTLMDRLIEAGVPAELFAFN